MDEMKKLTFFILTINTFLIADILSVESPNFKASCSTNIDFTLYKNSICNGGYTDFFKLICIELQIKRSLNLDTSEAKYYNSEQAKEYLKNIKENQCLKK